MSIKRGCMLTDRVFAKTLQTRPPCRDVVAVDFRCGLAGRGDYMTLRSWQAHCTFNCCQGTQATPPLSTSWIMRTNTLRALRRHNCLLYFS
jgi:hypothetical protein